MNSRNGAVPLRALNRRQFGLLMGGGALLLVAGGTYGVVSRSPLNSGTRVATAFGSLAVVRAGRLARLDAGGRIRFNSLAAAASHITGGDGGTPNHVGRAQFRAAGGNGGTGADGHSHGGVPQEPGWPQPVNLTWGDVVVLEVELHNDGQQPVLFSPGQLRLKLLPSAATVTPQDSDRSAGPIGPHATDQMLISYLAPPDFSDLELEYSDQQQDRMIRLALPPLSAGRLRS
jgi:hypothetical protein